MSLSENVTKAVEKVIENYVSQIATKYDLDMKELMSLWRGDFTPDSNSSKSKPSSITDLPTADAELDPTILIKMKKTELAALCKQRGLPYSGTKDKLISRLAGTNASAKKSNSNNKSVTKKKSPNKRDTSTTPVVKALARKTPTVSIRRNNFGNHEHPPSGLVFDKKTQKVIGSQNDNGEIDALDEKSIDICNQYGFDYKLPENLNAKSSLADVEVEELDDEEDDEEEEEEFEEEEVIDDDEEEEEEEEEEFEYEDDV